MEARNNPAIVIPVCNYVGPDPNGGRGKIQCENQCAVVGTVTLPDDSGKLAKYLPVRPGCMKHYMARVGTRYCPKCPIVGCENSTSPISDGFPGRTGDRYDMQCFRVCHEHFYCANENKPLTMAAYADTAVWFSCKFGSDMSNPHDCLHKMYGKMCCIHGLKLRQSCNDCTSVSSKCYEAWETGNQVFIGECTH
jgi:hypothetical protein